MMLQRFEASAVWRLPIEFLLLTVWGIALFVASPGICQDIPATEDADILKLHVIFRIDQSLAESLNESAIKAELTEYPHIKITVTTAQVSQKDESNIGISAAALLSSEDADAVIWFSGTDSVILHLYSRLDERFERKRTVEGDVASNIEAIFAIIRGWLDAMATCPPKPVPETSTPPAAPNINIHISSNGLHPIRPPAPARGKVQIEGAVTGTYATQLLMGAGIGIGLPILSKSVLFAAAAVYAPVESQYMDVSLSQRKHPVSLGIRRHWQLPAMGVAMGIGFEADIYYREVNYQTRETKIGVQPAIIASIRGSWLLAKRISLFMDAGARLILIQPIYDIVIYSAADTPDSTMASRRVRVYDARRVQPIILTGIAVQI